MLQQRCDTPGEAIGETRTWLTCARPELSRSAASSARATAAPAPTVMAEGGDFYLRYYVGHKGKFGHEFLEFELRPDGRLRYANNSNYKNDTMIRKEGAALQ